MKKYLAPILVIFVGIGLIVFTPDYQKSTGTTYTEICSDSENNSLGVGCIDGVREVVTDSVETNTLYIILYYSGVMMTGFGFIYLLIILFKSFVRNNS